MPDEQNEGQQSLGSAELNKPADNTASSSIPAAQSARPPSPPTATRSRTPRLTDDGQPMPKPSVNWTDQVRSPFRDSQMSPGPSDRVFPVRSVVSVDATPTAMRTEGYFPSTSQAVRNVVGSDRRSSGPAPNRTPRNTGRTDTAPSSEATSSRRESFEPTSGKSTPIEPPPPPHTRRRPAHELANLLSGGGPGSSNGSVDPSEPSRSARAPSVQSTNIDDLEPLVTSRFKHVVTEGGHAIITGRGGDTLQRCEDEPIHIPGAVQAFGLLVALEEVREGKLAVRVVSENSHRLIGYTPKQLFALESFTDIMSEEQSDNMLDHVDFIRDDETDVLLNGPEVFTISIRSPGRRSVKLWTAMHINESQKNLIICEFELEEDELYPPVPPNQATPEPPEDTLDSNPTAEEYTESTQAISRPLRVLRSARKRKSEAAAMEVFNIMSQVQEQLSAAPNLDGFLKTLVGVVKELTGFHRVMIYQFDQAWNGRVVTELVDPRATKDLYKGLNFPASDIPKQARDLYKINKVRMLYDRDLETARLVCRTVEDLDNPLDLTHAYLRAMSPIHIKYLANMAVRSSMSISINAFGELWGLIACHSYGAKGMRVSFPIRKMCRLVGDTASRNIERLSYASRLQARKLINTVPTAANPSGYIIASSEDLLKLFDADFGLLSIHDETKILGQIESTQEALAMLEYLRMRKITSVMTSLDITQDFPDLRYPPGFQVISGLLIVPLSGLGQDFIVFFRRGQTKEVKWAGNPYEKFIKQGTEGYLEPRKSFKTWSETVVGKCREWTDEEVETAAVLCLVYGKFIDVWRQKEAALQNSQLTRLLLANSAHEVRTPLNAIINYLEIALEGSLDQETRDNLAKSHSASKSLIYVINDLLDLTKTEEGGDLTKEEIFDIHEVFKEATDMFVGDARRKSLTFDVIEHPGLPAQVIGDGRRIRQAISNVTANAIENTVEGGVKIEMYVTARRDTSVDVEISISDSGTGMTAKKMDALLLELEQVTTEGPDPFATGEATDEKAIVDGSKSDDGKDGKTLGLGLALVARIIQNMNGQLRLKSEEGKGSRFIVAFTLDLPKTDGHRPTLEDGDSEETVAPATPMNNSNPEMLHTPPTTGEITLVDRGLQSAARRSSQHGSRNKLSRENSSDSTGSRRSGRSAKSLMSATSVKSARSEADRLIEAIQEPHHFDKSGAVSGRRSSGSRSRPRPGLEKRHTTADMTGSPVKGTTPAYLREQRIQKPGSVDVTSEGTPMSSIRVPNEFGNSEHVEDPPTAPRVIGHQKDMPDVTDEAPTAEHMRVLVAEDDPVNSRIIQKRLEKSGHEVYLTVNGEECASAYGEKTGYFDIVLMDMQMPIVDGLTSTKMIRSFEKSHPTHMLSKRAALNNRVPIVAVSASLLERERQMYIDAGFDGWILKPVSFDRLKHIMTGIVDRKVRRDNLYRSGAWERGGWFEDVQADIYAADTRPSGEVPMTDPSEGVKVAAASDDPFVKEEDSSRQTMEQKRMEETGKDEPPPKMGTQRAFSMPELGRKGAEDKGDEGEAVDITQEERVQSPGPVTSGLEQG